MRVVCWLEAVLCGLLYLARADVIGDGRSSVASTDEFFTTMDTDADGTVEDFEIRQAVAAFGDDGGQAMKPEEIEDTVEDIMSRMDSNTDGLLSDEEIETYSKRIGAVLTVSAVAEWVVHGLQLPEEVGELFASNSVTGYDFAELVEDDGAALIHDIGITRAVHRKKVLRAMRMLMTGVGNVPTSPSPFIPTVVPGSCETMELHWGRSDGRGFNVHKYRVFRREVEAASAGASSYAGPKGHGRWPLPTAGSQLSLPAGVGGAVGGQEAGIYGSPKQALQRMESWILVFDGIEQATRDHSIEPGKVYEYRVEAWNLFGRSEPTMAVAYGPTFAMCPRRSLFEPGLVPPVFWQVCEPLMRWVYWLAQFLWPVFGLVTALMRIRRNSPNHRRDRTDRSIDQWSWRVLAVVSRFIPYGHSFIPSSLRTDPGDTYMVSNTGSVSPAALGTAGMDNVLAPEMSRSLSRNLSHTKLATSVSGDSIEGNACKGKCHICMRRFKFGRRSKHHCRVCFGEFCAEHGETKHSWYTSCPVGGGCICKSCKDQVPILHAPPSFPKPDRLGNMRSQSTPTRKSAAVEVGGSGATALHSPAPLARGTPAPANATSNHHRSIHPRAPADTGTASGAGLRRRRKGDTTGGVAGGGPAVPQSEQRGGTGETPDEVFDGQPNANSSDASNGVAGGGKRAPMSIRKRLFRSKSETYINGR